MAQEMPDTISEILEYKSMIQEYDKKLLSEKIFSAIDNMSYR